jgi:outer membrane receptor protein involved in Fe transport
VRGIESSLDVRLFQHFIATLAYAAIQTEVVDNSDNPALKGKRFPQNPIHRGRAQLRYSDPRWALASLQVRAQSNQYEDDLNTLAMKGFAVVDVFAAVPIARGLQVYGVVQNIFDTRYLVGRAGVDTMGPPRLFLAGLRFQ